ncbi:MAG: hypothetical protein INR63_27125 [Actinomycetospora chiangmaiensis]|nr:hypothetical protein [Actinomycetospora chiangmaiensis]
MLIASFLLATNRERYDDGPSARRFQRQVLASLEPQIRPKGRRPFRHDIAVLPRFTEMHLRGPIN